MLLIQGLQSLPWSFIRIPRESGIWLVFLFFGPSKLRYDIPSALLSEQHSFLWSCSKATPYSLTSSWIHYNNNSSVNLYFSCNCQFCFQSCLEELFWNVLKCILIEIGCLRCSLINSNAQTLDGYCCKLCSIYEVTHFCNKSMTWLLLIY